ncbi:MAG: hypothetical protein XXXJIFNMEKO3_00771 [Candidatus Erwinia impunctatus]|nr:hypothetical protein XXXJIFNMEKO_00771 [Culicoides impunctatus]
MGTKASLLLVTMLTLCLPALAKVNAEEYQEFWLWSGVRPSSEMRDAMVVYLHQGEIISRQGKVNFHRMGAPVSRLTFPKVWLTVRITTTDIPEAVWIRIMTLLSRWKSAGNNVVGLQIDFDAATQRLDEYGNFLIRLRLLLPNEYALGVTGLLDWAKTGSVSTLNTLPVDELVIQSYQGRSTVVNYRSYLPALSQLTIPWKMGIVQHGLWEKEQEKKLSQSPWFKGMVVFMLN